MAVDKKFFVDINLQGNALNNATIGSNSDMTKGGSFRYSEDTGRLEYFGASLLHEIANLSDIAAVTGGLILQGGYNAATETPNITGGSALKGYFWVVTAAGSFLGESVQVGDSIIAKVNEAGASIGDWLILQGNVVIATDEVEGIVRLATQEEVDAGTEGGAVVLTPATFESSSQLADVRNDISALETDKLSRDGSQAMTGSLDMGANDISNAGVITANEVVTDILSPLDGVTITLAGNIDAENAAYITNLPAPINVGDAANKDYVDTAASTAQSNAEATASADATAKADAAQAAAETYADGVALTAENNANSYTDSAISQEVTDRNSAIATAKGEAIADANSYTDAEIAQEVIDRDAAIATAKSEAIADANSYTDAGLENKLDLAGGTMSGSINMSGNIIGNAEIENAVLANALNANNNTISNLVDPSSAQDAATKSYVDAQLGAAVFSQTAVAAEWTLDGGVYSLEVVHDLNSSTPKVSSYVSGNLVEFAVEVSNANTIVLKSNIAAPAIVSVGVSK
jgi:hypothetical protein